MNVAFFEVDGVLNFPDSEAKSPDGSMGIAESRVKKLRQKTEGYRLVLYGSWKTDWNFEDSRCTQKGVYLNKKLDRRGLHILDKTKDCNSLDEEIHDWLSRHPNVAQFLVLKRGDLDE